MLQTLDIAEELFFNNELLVVASAPRSGSSMVMQTLKLLGVRVDAPPFIPEHDGIRQYNPKGFYEHNLQGGIDATYKGAWKLFGGQILDTDTGLMKKVIHIQRDRKKAIESLARFHTQPDIHYDANVKCIEIVLKEVPHLKLTYEDMVQSPEKEIARIIMYLDIHPSEIQIEQSVKNIKS